MKRVTLSPNYISLMALSQSDIAIITDVLPVERDNERQEAQSHENEIKEGDICVEYKPTIDGEEMPKRYYRILGKINKLKDIDINAYLVKEVYHVDGEFTYNSITEDTHTKFSLTRSDCSFIGIDYQDGIEVYPFSSKQIFRKVETTNFKENESTEINYNDLSTYPRCHDGKIHRIVIQLRGFHTAHNGDLITPMGNTTVEAFLKSFMVGMKSSFSRYYGYEKVCSTRFVSKEKQTHNTVHDRYGNVFVEILTSLEMNMHIGVNDLFYVSYYVRDDNRKLNDEIYMMAMSKANEIINESVARAIRKRCTPTDIHNTLYEIASNIGKF